MTLLIYYTILYHYDAAGWWYVLGLFVWFAHLDVHSETKK